jgi:hypothetical protein
LLRLAGSSKIVNPDPVGNQTFVSNQRLGVMGSSDESSPYPTMVLENASSETETHVIDKMS